MSSLPSPENLPVVRQDNAPDVVSVDVLLGNSPHIELLAQAYAQKREVGALSVVATLAAQDAEYIRRQSSHNERFISELRNNFPRPHLSAEVTSYERQELLIDRVIGYTDIIRNLRAAHSISTFNLSLENTQSPELAELVGLRAASIWVKRPAAEAVRTERTANDLYGVYKQKMKTKIKDDEIFVPYVLFGDNTPTGSDKTSVLLSPLIGGPYNHHGKYGDPHNYDYIHAKGGGISFIWKAPMLLASMSPAEFTEMTATQNTLLTTPLTESEVENLLSHEDGRFTLGHDIISSIHLAKSRRQAKGDFNFKATAVKPFDGPITPRMFLEYRVLEQTTRTAAMLGKLDVLDKAKNNLIQQTQVDPSIKFVEQEQHKELKQ